MGFRVGVLRARKGCWNAEGDAKGYQKGLRDSKILNDGRGSGPGEEGWIG